MREKGDQKLAFTLTTLEVAAPAPAAVYTLSLHDALPISRWSGCSRRAASRWSARPTPEPDRARSEEHTPELQSQFHLVCRLLLEKNNSTERTGRNVTATAPAKSAASSSRSLSRHQRKRRA